MSIWLWLSAFGLLITTWGLMFYTKKLNYQMIYADQKNKKAGGCSRLSAKEEFRLLAWENITKDQK